MENKLLFTMSFSYWYIQSYPRRSGTVGPFRPTPEYEAGYSCFQQVRVFFVNSEILFCPNVILLFSHQDKLPFYKPLPTTMNHQQCRQGTPTEVVVLVLCLSTKVIHIYVYAQCVCKVMCISDVCTFFDCQVPISNSAMRGDCKWNLRRRNRST